MKDLRRSLAATDDARIARVVALLDRMADRGEADALLHPLRPRLSQIRPRRPLGFMRLLFRPVDPIIVAPALWRRTALTIPRTALAPIGRQVRAVLGDMAREIDDRSADISPDERDLVVAFGRRLWPAAGVMLAHADMPGDWTADTGLGPDDYRALAGALAVLLRQGVAIEVMAQQAAGSAGAPGPHAIGACLRTAAADAGQALGAGCGQAIGMLLAILLARLPDADMLITAAGDLAASLDNPATRQAADKAIDFMLDEIETGIGRQPDLALAAAEQEQIAALLETLEGSGPASRPVRRLRAGQLRRQIDTAARCRFTADMSAAVLARVACLSADTTDTDVTAIEQAARNLRRFETASRRLGGADTYDRLLREAGEALAASPATDTNRTDVARLVEILQGPEAALQVLRAAAAEPIAP